MQLHQLENRIVPAFGTSWADVALGGSAVGTATDTGANAVRLSGAGSGLGGTSDQAFFHYRTLDSDGTLTAQASPGGALMVRDGLGNGSAFAALTRTSGGWQFQVREPDGDHFTNFTATADAYAKIRRDGNVVNGYLSPTGHEGTWRLVGNASFQWSREVQAGLVASSGSSALTSVDFSGVTTVSQPPLGGGLESITYYSRSDAFVDLVKQANSFVGSDWNTPTPTDTNGWATSDFGVILQYGGANTGANYSGTYKLSFTGQATISIAFSPVGTHVQNQVYNAATNTTTAEVVLNAPPVEAGWYFALRFTNTQRTAGGVTNTGLRDLRVIRPGYSLTNTPTFTTPFLQQLGRFSNLRFMDWTETNNSTVTDWSQRAKATDARQSVKGVAWEYAIELANTLGKDLWINVPALATDDYVNQLATLLRDNLRPDLSVYVEYSNEVWNGGFAQYNQNRNAAIAAVRAGRTNGVPSPVDGNEADDGSSQAIWAMRRVAQRAHDIAAQFSTVWGSWAINTRVRIVLAEQFGNPYTAQSALEFANQTYGAPNGYFYAVASAPYFNTQSVDSTNTATVDDVLTGLRASMDATTAMLGDFHRWADVYGLRSVAYEGGPDTFGGNNIAAKQQAANDPRMQTLIQDYLNSWYGSGGDLFNWFVAGATSWDTSFGTWGLTDNMSRPDTPKARALDAVLAAPAVPVVAGRATGEFDASAYAGSTNGGPLFPTMGQSYDYRLDAPQAGAYTLRLRYASANGGILKVWVNNVVAATVNLPATGGATTYTLSAPVALTLPSGGSVVRLEAGSHQAYRIQSLVFGTPLTRTQLGIVEAASSMTLTASVTAADHQTSAGGVTFYAGTTYLGAATLDANGRATLTVAKPAGNSLIYARYVGDADHATSTSAAQAVAGVAAAPAAAPTVSNVQVGDGSAQRSQVRSLAVTFSSVVTLDPTAFALTNANRATVPVTVTTATVNGRTVATLTFAQLTDGNYSLAFNAAAIRDAATGTPLGGTPPVTFRQRFGDADGNGAVAAEDVTAFLNAYGTSLGQAGYQGWLDKDGNGAIDAQDVTAMLNAYGA